MSNEKLEGRIRAIEAILLELPEVTPDIIEAAKARIRDPKRQREPKLAEAMLQIGGHLDEPAEKALDNLKYQAEQRRAGARSNRASPRDKDSHATSSSNIIPAVGPSRNR
ncbi:MAG TPA: hypothetical protein VH678_10060 [Xanthobacteraceae bacterium]|jgi:hypothetical protein